ncbi:MAG: RluA family pseudouridine synthase [Prevotella sp.]|nr:RluA family pseudouridine synthase [Prevotella sp.]
MLYRSGRTAVTILKVLHTTILPPSRMNNPLNYTPHPLCVMAAEEVRRMVRENAVMSSETRKSGKMFGVLVVETPDGNTGYLAAYSGQIAGRSNWDGFVPAVFDYLQDGGYFKTCEAEITAINKQVRLMETSEERRRLLTHLDETIAKAASEEQAYKTLMHESKVRRDSERAAGGVTPEREAEMTRESQFQKAELRRMRRRNADTIAMAREACHRYDTSISLLKQKRRTMSDRLQEWLFHHFVMLNKDGDSRSLTDIFRTSLSASPPAGAGECCEPRLLQYAFSHAMTPKCMAMFWIGASPEGEIRHEQTYYPACRSKCKPILEWMLGKDIVKDDTFITQHNGDNLTIIYQDSDIIVVDKPARMLSVPGKNDAPSVLSLLQRKMEDNIFPVHRLDMDTSGLMVFVRNKKAQRNLQRQFETHSIVKRYIALLERKPDSEQGTISLPLSPDMADRPRQMVDYRHGKQALTHYRLCTSPSTPMRRQFLTVGDNLVELSPLTGRTHQLRVHCAHPDGLASPIVGDRLYGTTNHPRLCLHAEYLEFRHPTTGEIVIFKN